MTARRERVFVSYAREDERWALWSGKKMVSWSGKQMVSFGFDVELDKWSWRGGDDFVERMNKALANAAKLHYLPAKLPHLPFRERSFDLVLCSHLLFTYVGTLDLEFHISAIDEMRRVCNNELRIYPLVGFMSDASSTLSEVLRYLKERAIFAEVASVDYCFQKGSGRMLRILC